MGIFDWLRKGDGARPPSPSTPQPLFSAADREKYEQVLADIFYNVKFARFAQQSQDRKRTIITLLKTRSDNPVTLAPPEIRDLSDLKIEGLLVTQHQSMTLNKAKTKTALAQLQQDTLHPVTAVLSVIVNRKEIEKAKQILGLVFKRAPGVTSYDPNKTGVYGDIPASKVGSDTSILRYEITQLELDELQKIVERHPEPNLTPSDSDFRIFLTAGLKPRASRGVNEEDISYTWFSPATELEERQREGRGDRRGTPPDSPRL